MDDDRNCIPFSEGRWIIVGVLVLAAFLMLVGQCSAEWGLYTHRDSHGWQLEKTFAFFEDCNWKARELYRSGQVLGSGCAEYSTSAYTPQQPQQQVRQPQQPQQQQPTIKSGETQIIYDTKAAAEAEYQRRLDQNKAADDYNSYLNVRRGIGR